MSIKFLFPRGGIARAIFALAFIAAAAAGYYFFMAHAMPAILKPYLERKAGELVGGEASIAALEIFPFELALKARGLSAKGEAASIGFDSLLADMQLRSLPLRSICMDEFGISGLRIGIVLARGGEASAGRLAEEAFRSRSGAPAHIKRFALRDGSLEVSDRRGEEEKKFGIAPVSFSIENFSTQHSAGEGNDYSLQFTGLGGGFFRWSGSLQWTPFLSEGEMEMRGFDLRLSELGGKLDLRADYRVSEEPELGVSLRNAGAVLHKPYLFSARAEELRADSLRVSTLERSLRAGSVSLEGAEALFVLREFPKIDANVFDFLRLGADAPDSLDGSENMFSAFLKRAGNLRRWDARIDSARVSGANIALIDSSGGAAAEHSLSSLNLIFENITNNASDSARFSGDAILNSGKLGLSGAARLFPLQVLADLDLKDFPLASLQSYLSRGTWLSLRQGQAGASLAMRFRPAADSSLRDTLVFSGSAEAEGLHLLGRSSQEFLKAPRAEARGVEFSFAPRTSWQIADASLQSPSMSLIWHEKAPANYSQIAKPGARAERIPFIINNVSFSKGSLYFIDKDPATPFSYSMADARGNLRNLSNQKRDANMFVQGKMGGYAPFSLKGSLNLSGKYPRYNLSMEAANQDLVAFSPYSGKYAGYRIAKGQASFQAEYDVKDNKMQGSNHIVVQHLTFGEAVESAEATNLPVRLAAALLSDKNGVIDLDVAVSGDLDDPEFSIGSVIWKVIKNLLGKAASAPFKSLMSLIGSNADPESIAFAPGSAQIAKPQLDMLKDLSRALMQRQGLQLDIYGRADSISDGNALREAQQPAGAIDLKNLSRARAQNIKRELVNMNASLGERVFVVDDGELAHSAAHLKVREM